MSKCSKKTLDRKHALKISLLSERISPRRKWGRRKKEMEFIYLV